MRMLCNTQIITYTTHTCAREPMHAYKHTVIQHKCVLHTLLCYAYNYMIV